MSNSFNSKFGILTLCLILCFSSITIIPKVSATLSSNEGDGWDNIDIAWFAKTRHGGAGGFRASVGIDPSTPQGQNGWFAGGWTWTSGTTYHFSLEYDATTEIAELYVIGQNDDNPLCTYSVGPSQGRIGINARTAPESGRSTVIENIKFNGITVGPDDSVTATSSSGESAVRHLLIEGADLTTDFILEGDYTFDYGSSTHDECPSIVINIENVDDRLCTIHFVTPLRGLDGDTSGWSTAENLVNLSTGTWSLLNGTASVTGYTRDILGYYLTQRGTRGLGINGHEDDEVDSYGRPEVIDVSFITPHYVDYIEIRSLFDEWWGIEEGEIELWLNEEIVETIHVTGVEELEGSNTGELGVEINPPTIIDKIIFWVPPNQPYTAESEFAVAKINLIELDRPIAVAQGPYSGTDNEIVTLNASASYDPDGTIENYEWTLNGTTIYNGTISTKELNLDGMLGSSYDLTLIVTDDDGLTDTESTTLTVYNLPVAEANGPYSGTTVETITLDATGSYDPDGPIENYEWLINGNSVYSGESLTHTENLYTYDDGTYDVELIVTDTDGYTDNDTTFVTVNNEIPIANVGGPYDAYYEEDYTVYFDGLGSYDVDGEIVSYEWDFGDGTHGHGMNPVHIYGSPVSAKISLTVTDNDGATDTDTATITYHGDDEFPPIIQLIHPEGGELLSKMETVRWYAIDDTLRGKELPIRLYYSRNGVDWMRLTQEPLCNNIDIEHGSYEWDTTQLSDGSYFLKAQVIGTGGTSQDTSKAFTIDNENMGLLVSHVMIEDISIDSTNWVKTGDDVIITASITGEFASMLTNQNITANLSVFGSDELVTAHEYNGFIAKWIISDVLCSKENGVLQIPIYVDGEQKAIGRITADNTPPDLSINKPTKGLYLFNIRVIPFGNTMLLGKTTVELDLQDNFEIKEVDFIVDGVILSSIDHEPFIWNINIRTMAGIHTLKVIARDKAENSKTVSKEIIMFNLNGSNW